ncbi:hypothetical protein EU546_08440 [Candidatus Thorarchaeota archaeon]|nr:MAG: hypothetical protein EU546_08440 [Candidatus Thorarchaeota archaeon]
MIYGDFVLPVGSGPFPGICKFHGLPGGADQVSGFATDLAEAGFAVLTFDFRGFRRSDGIFSLPGQLKDASNAVTHLLNSGYAIVDWLGVYAASYGGPVAIISAAQDERIDAVCLRAPVYDLPWFVNHPMVPAEMKRLIAEGSDVVHGLTEETMSQMHDQMLKDAAAYDLPGLISQISSRPLMITTGLLDRGIDSGGVRRLFEAAKEPKEFHLVKEADHVLSNPEAYQETSRLVVEWFTRICPYL